MKKHRFYYCILIYLVFCFCSCSNLNNSDKKDLTTTPANNDSISIKEINSSYSAAGLTMNGFIAYNDKDSNKRPAILIVHEWWGLTEYPKERARQLAKLGYIAMAVDMYGNGRIAADPKEAQALATPFYKDPSIIKPRIEAAMQKLKSIPQTDTSNIAAIGYCYGGFIVLNAAKMGEPFKAVVSFHGDLSGLVPDKNTIKSKFLICHGADDKFVTKQAVDLFKHQMDSANIDYTFKSYPNATHAFTNPDATAIGKKFNMPIAYNAEADKNSWNDMKAFFKKIL